MEHWLFVLPHTEGPSLQELQQLKKFDRFLVVEYAEEIKELFEKWADSDSKDIITLETNEGVKMYYAPASLYWDLKNRRSETNFIKYEGMKTSERCYEYPVFKFSK